MQENVDKFQSIGFLMVATSTNSGSAGAYAWFQSLSGFLMVATEVVDEQGLVVRDLVSIPIGFSNGCNGDVGHVGVDQPGFQSLSGFLMVATTTPPTPYPQKTRFNPYRVF